MNKERLTNISSLLADYSKGYFHNKVEVSDKLDEIDSIIMGINMLGEELVDTTISKNIFENIFNSVTNILFIVNQNGVIIGSNKYGSEIKSIKINDTLLSHIFDIKGVDDSFEHLVLHPEVNFESQLLSKKDKVIYTLTSIVSLSSKTIENDDTFLVIAEDVTSSKEHNLQIIKTIIDTQEIERKRVADDLHDSLGQELSSIRMMFSALDNEFISPSNTDIINTCNSILEKSISDLRSICFNLMPASLESGNLVTAVRELINNTLIKTKFTTNSIEILLKKDKTIAIYRVFQEFLSNSIKHSKANLVSIKIHKEKAKISIDLNDDGIGFKMNSSNQKGRGLMTMKNRINSIGGNFNYKSDLGKGTHLKIIIKCEQ